MKIQTYFSSALRANNVTQEDGDSNQADMEMAKKLQNLINEKVFGPSAPTEENGNSNGDVAPGPSKKRIKIHDILLGITLTARNESDSKDMTFRVEGNMLETIRKIFGSGVRVKLLMEDFLQNVRSLSLSMARSVNRPPLARQINPLRRRPADFRGNDDDDDDVFNNMGGRNIPIGVRRNVHAQPQQYDVQSLSSLMSLSTKEMEINQEPGSYKAFCEDNVAIPEPLWTLWVNQGSPISGLFSIQLIFNKPPNFEGGLINNVTKRILNNGIATDITIIAENDAHVKCHKAFLLAHEIPAFEAMFGGEFEEGKTNTVKMDDMGEEGVKALLAFLYHFDIEAAYQKCDIAFELLNAAVKYDIASLKSKMITLILKQSDPWCSVDVALQMFMLARGMDNGEILCKSAIEIIKRNSDNFKSSDIFRGLMTTNPDVMTEIMELICKTKK